MTAPAPTELPKLADECRTAFFDGSVPQKNTALRKASAALRKEEAARLQELVDKKYAAPEYPDAAMVCAELYQVIGYLAFHYGISDHPDVVKAMDNASQHVLVHADLLPWPKHDLPGPSVPSAECK